MTDTPKNRLGNISELPEELKNELRITKSNKLDSRILDVINDKYSGKASIDEVLVGLYRRYNEVHKRPFIANKLYRMSRAGMLTTSKDRKGVYSTKKGATQ